MKISIFGLGYVGAVSAGVLAAQGHQVIGADPNPTKVDLINRGLSPIIEKDLPELIEAAARNGRLTATTSASEAVAATEISLLCVGTPSRANGSLDLQYIERVCEEIGQALAAKDTFHVVVARSTMLPGTVRELIMPTLEAKSGKTAGRDFGVCINPEFLREGTAVNDFYHPPKTVIGETDEKSGDAIASLYENLNAPLVRTDVETAEMVKYADNVWHALKVGFANEIGNICKAQGIDSHAVMDIFCKDTKLNLSPYYLKPGFAFGGSCLPKDVRALTYKSKQLDLETPILDAIMPSNQRQIETGIRMITELGRKRIGILGFSFKAGTDDLRESPLVAVIEHLIGKGYDLKIYDRNVNLASLMGANKDYILKQIPHISALMSENIEEVTQHAEVLVIGNKAIEFTQALETINANQTIIDIVRIRQTGITRTAYNGICW
jgi:GDP-mannose 6-dehydrogenase